jgi:hypothetical protein
MPLPVFKAILQLRITHRLVAEVVAVVREEVISGRCVARPDAVQKRLKRRLEQNTIGEIMGSETSRLRTIEA